MRKILSILLFPLTIWYAVAIGIRNLFFRTGVFKQERHVIPTICVGNLSTGGTGKTPHVEYLIRLLGDKVNLAVLSRGYGRKTNGFILANQSATAQTIGDEPLQYYKKFKNIRIAVCESRNEGVEKLQQLPNPPEVIILDDAFQHKSIVPSFKILLTEYAKPFYKDCILPFGNLREFRSASHTADIVVVTKCPKTLTASEKQRISNKVNARSGQKVLFSSIQYGNPVALTDFVFSDFDQLLIVTGIANPQPLYDFFEQDYPTERMVFPDHHTYSEKDILNIRKRFEEVSSLKKAIITTEKDAMRLNGILEFKLLNNIPIFYIPIEVYFPDSEKLFDETMLDIVTSDR